MLNSEQQRAYELMEKGCNVFLTGNAGTGKSYLLNYFIKTHSNKRIMVTAPTGVSALNIGGVTIHRAFGITKEKSDTSPVPIKNTIRNTDILIIDEISMCRIDLFDIVVKTLIEKKVKYNLDTQLIVVGDFFQLPPVVTQNDRKLLERLYGRNLSYYAFESPLWNTCGFNTVILHEIVRQEDSEFICNLNKLRVGDTSCFDYLDNAVEHNVDNAISVVSTNNACYQINKRELDKLDSKSVFCYEKHTGSILDIQQQMIFNKELEYKVGARVLCTVNDECNAYVNGSFGTIVKFNYNKKHKVESINVRLDNGRYVDVTYHTWEIFDYKSVGKKGLEKKVIATYTQMPLLLAYAITIHRSQGQSYDRVIINPNNIFNCGQLYVAFSRCRDFNNMALTDVVSDNSKRNLVNANVLCFYDSLRSVLSEEL